MPPKQLPISVIRRIQKAMKIKSHVLRQLNRELYHEFDSDTEPEFDDSEITTHNMTSNSRKRKRGSGFKRKRPVKLEDVDPDVIQYILLKEMLGDKSATALTQVNKRFHSYYDNTYKTKTPLTANNHYQRDSVGLMEIHSPTAGNPSHLHRHVDGLPRHVEYFPNRNTAISTMSDRFGHSHNLNSSSSSSANGIKRRRTQKS